MDQQQVFEKVVEIIRPFVKAPAGVTGATMDTTILADLRVNSARLVDVVLEIEDAFGIAVTDDQADKVHTIGDAVRLIMAAKS